MSCAFQISRNPHHGPEETINNSSTPKPTTGQSQLFPSSSHSRRMEHGSEVVQNHQLVENPTPNTFEQPDARRSDLQDLHMEGKTIVYHLGVPTIDTHAPAGNGSSCTMGEGPPCFRTPPPAVLSSHTKSTVLAPHALGTSGSSRLVHSIWEFTPVFPRRRRHRSTPRPPQPSRGPAPRPRSSRGRPRPPRHAPAPAPAARRDPDA